MNKQDLINAVANTTGFSKADTAKSIDAIFEAIASSLSNKETCQFVGFGSFKVSPRAARTGRNPRTGEEISIPASHAVRFVPGKKLKDSIN